MGALRCERGLAVRPRTWECHCVPLNCGDVSVCSGQCVLAVSIGYADTVRLIQGGAIDLVRHLLSCNDQPSIKIPE